MEKLNENYTHFVIIPHFLEGGANAVELIKKIPAMISLRSNVPLNKIKSLVLASLVISGIANAENGILPKIGSTLFDQNFSI